LWFFGCEELSSQGKEIHNILRTGTKPGAIYDNKNHSRIAVMQTIHNHRSDRITEC